MSEPTGPAQPPPAPPPAAQPQGGDNKTLMLVLSYLGLLGLIPLLVEKEDRDVQWHAKNGLVIFGGFLAVWLVLTVIGIVAPTGLGCVLALLNMVLWVGYIVVMVLGIMKAMKGEQFRLPVLSDFADKWQSA